MRRSFWRISLGLRTRNFKTAARKEKPKRAVMVLTAFFLSAALGMVYVVVVNRYQESVQKVTQVFSNRKLRAAAPYPL